MRGTLGERRLGQRMRGGEMMTVGVGRCVRLMGVCPALLCSALLCSTLLYHSSPLSTQLNSTLLWTAQLHSTPLFLSLFLSSLLNHPRHAPNTALQQNKPPRHTHTPCHIHHLYHTSHSLHAWLCTSNQYEPHCSNICVLIDITVPPLYHAVPSPSCMLHQVIR